MPLLVRHAYGIALFILAAATIGAAPATAEEFSDAQKSEIEKIVGEYIAAHPELIADYLRKNPEILIEVSTILKEKQAQQEREAAAYAVEANRPKIERHPMSPTSGNAQGDVTLVEFFDYNCVYCKKVFAYMMQLADEDPKLRIVWKDLPILGPVSHYAAKAAMAAHRQGKYMAFHMAAMGGGRLTSEAQVLQIAAEVGLDIDRLKKDIEDPAIEAYLQETIDLAGLLGINGTPGFVVGKQIIAGALEKDNMKRLIEHVRVNGS